MSLRLGADIGGTFTDVVLAHPGGVASAKVLTDYARPEAAILRGIAQVCAEAGVAPSSIEQVIHGTTLVTNALIERRGARLAFVTTEGFRDVIEMRSENRFEQYDLNLELPPPLVPRRDRLTVSERIGPGGEVLLALDPGEAQAMAAQIAGAGYDAVAVGFMHAYANDAHERIMADALAEAAPDLPVSLSSVVSPRMRELPRFNTVVANAYVQPLVSSYLSRLVDALQADGIGADVFLMHSGGGLISVDTAIAEPVRLLESGPAGGAIFAAGFTAAHGIDSALSFDMGGTTAKICLIEEARPKTTDSFEIARSYRFKKGSGMLVSTPVVEMVEIGAGGGSIASTDTMGRIQVGPKSAGSEPGPAAYQRGGMDPTVTDANLLLGRLDPDAFAGGAIPLSVALAEGAIDRLAQVQDMTVADTAFGVTEMVDENMANAARVHTVENGRDISRFTMIAFGGGAPLHAARQCEKLGITACLIPPGAGVGSALGFLRAPVSYVASRGLYQTLDAFDADRVNLAVREMTREAEGFVRRGAGDARTEARLVAQMRYTGQGWEIPVALPYRAFDKTDDATLRQAFEAAYETLFGRTIAGLSAEVTNWTLEIATVTPDPVPVLRRTSGPDAEVTRMRPLYDAALRRHVDAREVARAAMVPGSVAEGPAIITEAETSTIVTSAFRAIAQDDGCLLLMRKDPTS